MDANANPNSDMSIVGKFRIAIDLIDPMTYLNSPNRHTPSHERWRWRWRFDTFLISKGLVNAVEKC